MVQLIAIIVKEITQRHKYRSLARAGFRGFKSPPKFSDFFLKVKENVVERKKMRRDGGGGLIVNIFWGSEIFLSGVQKFSGG